MRLSDFDFDLPERLIALRPAEPRDSARLLVVQGLARQEALVRDLPVFLRPGDLLVMNDTRVIAARLLGMRAARGEGAPVRIDVQLNRRLDRRRWSAFARPGKRLRAGDKLIFAEELAAHVDDKQEGGLVVLTFDCEGLALDAAIAAIGQVPLPPYIVGRRAADDRDRADYQTVFAANPGAVAAPTAGLHFTDRLLAALDTAGIKRVMLTLHVGAGTFLPVTADDPRRHNMQAEWGCVTAETARAINDVRAAGGRIVAVGTTSLRLLETACDANGIASSFEGETQLYILPGDKIKSADLLLTNFHLPRSTLFMLVQAFGGVEAMRAAYAHAIAHNYRFYSYGDACLIYRSSHG